MSNLIFADGFLAWTTEKSNRRYVFALYNQTKPDIFNVAELTHSILRFLSKLKF